MKARRNKGFGKESDEFEVTQYGRRRRSSRWQTMGHALYACFVAPLVYLLRRMHVMHEPVLAPIPVRSKH